MNERRIGLICRFVFWSCALAVLVLSLVPATSAVPTTGWDKTNHLAAFACLAFLGCRAYPGHLVTVFAGLLAYGAFIEVLQSFTPDRFAEFGDLWADGAGLLVGGALARLSTSRVLTRA